MKTTIQELDHQFLVTMKGVNDDIKSVFKLTGLISLFESDRDSGHRGPTQDRAAECKIMAVFLRISDYFCNFAAAKRLEYGIKTGYLQYFDAAEGTL